MQKLFSTPFWQNVAPIGALALLLFIGIRGPSKVWADISRIVIGGTLPPVTPPPSGLPPSASAPPAPEQIIHQSGSSDSQATVISTAGLHASAILGSSLVSTQGGTSYLLVTLEGSSLPTTRERVPLNLALVLDKSGSMSGAKLASVKSSLVQMADLLLPSDQVTLVIYSDSVTTAFTGSFDKEKFVSAVQNVTDNGGTNIEGGLREGILSVQRGEKVNALKKVILLSDGLANVGISKAEDLARLTKQLAGDSVSVTTIGVGADYDENLMSQVAIAGRGRYYFMEGPTDAPRIFADELDHLMNITARDITVDLGLSPIWKLERSIGYVNTGSTTFQPQPVAAGRKVSYLFELKGKSSDNGNVDSLPIANIKVNFKSTLTGRTESLTLKVPAPKFTSQVVNPLTDDSVYKAFMEAYVADQLEQSDKYLDQVQNDEARRLLDQTLKDVQSANQRLPGSFDSQVRTLEVKQQFLIKVGSQDIKQNESGRLFKKSNQYDAASFIYNK